MKHWQGKKAIITGGSSGLGFALARVFLARGMDCVIAARNEEKLNAAVDSLAKETNTAGCTVFAISADITKQEDVDRLFKESLEKLGTLDMLVNCAGKSARASVLDTSPEDFEALMQINLLGAVRCSKAAVPFLVDSKGYLVNVGSLASKFATVYYGAYPATKFALAAYTQQLRLALGPQGVQVLHVCPGPLATKEKQTRHIETADNLPEGANLPGAGANIGTIDPQWLAERILSACEKRKPELIVPRKAWMLGVLSAISPKLGDWLLRRNSST